MPPLFDNIFAGQSGVASTLLDTVGISAKITIPGARHYDPARDEEVREPDTEINVKSTPPEEYQISEIDGTNILLGDLIATVGAYELANFAKEQLERATYISDSANFAIVKVKPVYSGDKIAIFELQMRKL